MTSSPEGERIAKIIARRGFCSRRDAEKLIAEKRVRVEGVLVTSPATRIAEDARIEIDHTPVPVKTPSRLWIYHKPKAMLTSARDPQGRACVFDHLPKELPRVISVGRLDFNSEGLLLLTNDGALARRLELPSNQWKRRYRVRAYGKFDPKNLQSLTRGVTIEGVRYAPAEITHERSQHQNHWFTITITEGKNREVRKLMESVNLTVNRLLRVAFGPFQLGNLKAGEVKEIPSKVLKEQLGSTK